MAVTRRSPKIKFRSTPVAGIAPDAGVPSQPAGEVVPFSSGGQGSNQQAGAATVNMGQVREAVLGVIGRLQGLADDQVRLKAIIEERWYEDLRRYHGRYDQNTEQELRKSRKSRLFANVTRPKTTAWEARLSDLLFPTDDKNWAISPTPVPEMSDAAKQATKQAVKAARQASDLEQSGNPDGAQQVADAGTGIAKEGEAIEEEMDEAKRRADLMSAEIEDQLEECQYNIRCREVLHDLCKLGTGVMKGPVASQKKRRAWEQQDGSNIYQLGQTDDGRPTFMRTDPWNFFPDMSARTAEEAEFTFERHLWNSKQLRTSAKALGFDPKETAELLRERPREPIPQYWALLRDITSNMQPSLEHRYQVWEYRGSLEREDIEAIGSAIGPDVARTLLDNDPLMEINVVIWFCQGRLLKIGPGPLDSNEPLYSVVAFERDDTSMFGFGVPYLIADSQSAKNAAWRMMMDNGGLSVGPQIVIDKTAITPVDGTWDLYALKIWQADTNSLTRPEGYKPFQIHQIESHQDQLGAIIELADRFADDETSMPKVAEGDQGSHVQTAQAVSMLMNSANVVFRRVVKNIDDMLTTPNIRRAYDWNMQFSPREDIKGDYEVTARGSSVLIIRELQLQNLNQMMAQFSAHPVIGPMGKWADVFRKYAQAAHISADEIVKPDELIEREAAERARQAAQQAQAPLAPKGKSPEELAQEKELKTLDAQTRLKVADLARETALIALAQQSNMKLADLKNKLQLKQIDVDHKERTTAAEAAIPAASHIGGSEF